MLQFFAIGEDGTEYLVADSPMTRAARVELHIVITDDTGSRVSMVVRSLGTLVPPETKD